MKRLIVGSLILTGAAIAVAAVVGSSGNAPIATGEAPQFANMGAAQVGTLTTEITLPDRVRISTVGVLTGTLPREDRTVEVRLWYPADVGKGAAQAIYRHTAKFPASADIIIEE